MFFSCKKEILHTEKPAQPFSTAGTNQTDVEDFQVTLNADALKDGQNGKWTISKGLIESKVYFSNDTRPDSKFNGMPGESYELRWTVTSGTTKYSESTVKVSFKPLQASISNAAPGTSTRLYLTAKNYEGGVWSIDGKYASLNTQNFGGTVIPDINSPNILLQCYANRNYKITWTTYYGSKHASTTLNIKTGDYLESEALDALQLDSRSYRVSYENGHITKLDLSSSKFGWILQDTAAFPSVQALKHLKELRLQGSSINKFPEVIGEIYRNLEYLNVDGTGISSVASNIGNLKKLKKLLMSNTQYGAQIYSLPESVGDLESLEYWKLSSIGLKYVPESISRLKKLKVFDCSLNSVEKLPANLGNMENLEFITVTTQESIPASVSKLSKLRRMEWDCGATSVKLPDDFGNLASLDTLSLIGKYTSLPSNFGNLRLKQLLLTTPQLSSLPESFGNMKELITLTVGGTFKTLPNSFSQLTALKYLILGGHIEQLPKDFGRLKSLTYLDIQFSSLNELPESIGDLSNLTEINLNQNQLQALPLGLFKLPKLSKLWLSYNKLSTIPTEFSGLADVLTQLYINGNNFSAVDKARLRSILPKTFVYMND